MPAMASNTQGLITIFIGFPSVLVGSTSVGLIYGANQFTPTQNKKITGLIIGVIFLLFDGWIIFTDTLGLIQGFINRSFDFIVLVSIVEIIACLSLVYCTFQLLIDKPTKS